MKAPSLARLLLPFALLAACHDETDEVPLSCAYDPHDWYDNAFYTFRRSSDGVFDFDPIGDEVVGRVGMYDLETGDFDWTDTYASGHFLVSLVGTGFGTIYETGDLDLLTRNTTTDVLGEVTANRYRVEREGCSGTVKVTEWEPDLDPIREPPVGAEEHEWTTQIVADDEVHGHIETTVDTRAGDLPYVADAVYREDVAAVVTADIGDGIATRTETWQYDGTGVGTWAQQGEPFGSDYDVAGSDEYYFDGSWLTDYWGYEAGTQTAVYHWILLYQYDGSAEGTFWYDYGSGELDCDVTITTDGECTADCGPDGIFDCS
ncbi:MAG: hypothetical protein JXB39_05390 [Deltaproteobacteria bacterium]|nr:hypothetical protein [Deltaproteobacteria bacterium]